MAALFTTCPICLVSTAQGAGDNDVVYRIVIGSRDYFYDTLTGSRTCKCIDHSFYLSEIFLQNCP